MATFYIDTESFSTATAVWEDSNLTTKAPDGFYSFSGIYRQQFDGLLLSAINCVAPPVPTGCFEYLVSTTSSSSQCYSYIDCEGTEQTGCIGAIGGYDSRDICAQEDTVILLGSEMMLNVYGPC